MWVGEDEQAARPNGTHLSEPVSTWTPSSEGLGIFSYLTSFFTILRALAHRKTLRGVIIPFLSVLVTSTLLSISPEFADLKCHERLTDQQR